MCSSEDPLIRYERTTTEICIINYKRGLPWELAAACSVATGNEPSIRHMNLPSRICRKHKLKGIALLHKIKEHFTNTFTVWKIRGQELLSHLTYLHLSDLLDLLMDGFLDLQLAFVIGAITI
jgi:hypothetical protein